MLFNLNVLRVPVIYILGQILLCVSTKNRLFGGETSNRDSQDAPYRFGHLGLKSIAQSCLACNYALDSCPGIIVEFLFRSFS